MLIVRVCACCLSVHIRGRDLHPKPYEPLNLQTPTPDAPNNPMTITLPEEKNGMVCGPTTERARARERESEREP